MKTYCAHEPMRHEDGRYSCRHCGYPVLYWAWNEADWEEAIQNWMILNREDFDSATQLAEGALAEFPNEGEDEAIAFELAAEVFYGD